MSRPKSIDSLLNGPASEIAPTVTDLSKQAQTEPAPDPKPEPAKQAKAGPVEDQAPTPKPRRTKPTTSRPKQETPAKSEGLSVAGQPIRVQISTSDGSEIAAALEEVRGNIPCLLDFPGICIRVIQVPPPRPLQRPGWRRGMDRSFLGFEEPCGR